MKILLETLRRAVSVLGLGRKPDWNFNQNVVIVQDK